MGNTAPVKERRVLNDPKVLLGADFNQIPVSVMFDVILGSPYRMFCFVGDATQVEFVRTAFFLWAMQHRWTCCSMSDRLTWPRTPFLRSPHLTALFYCAKNDLLPLFDRCLTHIIHVRDETASKTSPCGERAVRHSLRHVLTARTYLDLTADVFLLLYNITYTQRV